MGSRTRLMRSPDEAKIVRSLDDGGERVERRLEKVEKALAHAHLHREWGVAGFREESLFFLVADCFSTRTCRVQYEPLYGDRSLRRGDFALYVRDAKRGAPAAFVEAKWWWRGELEPILKGLAAKLRRLPHPETPRYALIFTVDERCKGATWDWSSAEAARRWMKENCPTAWTSRWCAALKTRYVGGSSAGANETQAKVLPRRDSIFVAALYLLNDAARRARPRARARARA